MSLLVRAATADDAPAVAEITRAAFAAHAELVPPPRWLCESVSSVAGDLQAFGGLLASLDSVPVAALRYSGAPPLRWLRRVAVHPDHQGQGFGGRLLAAAANEAARARLSALRARARLEVEASLRFYRNHGFVELATAPTWVEFGRPLPRAVDTPEQMRALGARLARLLAAGDLVLLTGELGAGKTVLAQGIGAGLGVTGPVTSPTFVISRRHRGPDLDLLHADAYRLGARAELDDLDLDSELDRAVAVVEWGEGLAEGLAERRWLVHLERAETEAEGETRQVTLRAAGPDSGRRQDRLDREV